MDLRLVTVSLDAQTGAFPLAPLSDLSGEVVSVVEHFFHFEGMPKLLLVVHYRPPPDEPSSPAPPATAKTASAPAALSAEETARFEVLRAWRSGRAKADGVPVYLILSNRQLNEIARRQPATLKALRQIKGIGDAKTKRYGPAVLALLHPPPEDAPAPAAEGADVG